MATKTGKKTYKQKPTPGVNRFIDLVRDALPVGWRVSKKTGNKYFENLENRSDTDTERRDYAAKKTTKKAPTKKPATRSTPKRAASKKAKPRRKATTQKNLF